MAMFLIGFVPPLFRKVMDPLVLENVDGDMSKVLTKEFVRTWEAEQRALENA